MSGLHAGLDVADQTVCVCIVDDNGAVVFESLAATTPEAVAKVLRPYRRRLRQVGQETGGKAAWLHKELVKRRFPMICLDARHAQAALSAKPNKTDKNDARGLALLLARGIFTSAHVKSDDAQGIRLLLNVRKTLQRKALDLQTSMRMSAKSFGIPCHEKRRRVSTTEKAGDDPSLHRLFRVMQRASEQLLEEVKTLDRMVRKRALADPVCRRLMTAPGVGPITALTFRAAVDDPARFRRSRDVAAHFGLTPRRYQSGFTAFSGHITGKGDPTVRASLYDAACSLLNNTRSASELRSWAVSLRERRGFKVAAVATARKLATVMHRMWVTERDFQSSL